MIITRMDPPEALPAGAQAWRIERDDQHTFPITSVGPWTTEPDKAQWVDPDTGLDCLIVRNRGGALCGYVGVPVEHPAFGQDYNDVDVHVHGGLTYADTCQQEGEAGEPSGGICHVPLPGRPHEIYWLGFDCAHAWDLSPGMRDWEREHMPQHLLDHKSQDVYRDLGYVVCEITALARQLSQIAA